MLQVIGGGDESGIDRVVGVGVGRASGCIATKIDREGQRLRARRSVATRCEV